MVSFVSGQMAARRSFFDRLYDLQKAIPQLFLFKQEHALYYTPILFACGIATYFSFLFEPDPRVSFNVWIGSLALLILSQQVYAVSPKYNYLRIFAFVTCLVISGFFVAQYRTIQVHAPMLSEPLKFASVEGTVQAIDILPEGQGQRLTLYQLNIKELKDNETPYSIRLKVRTDQVSAR